jgi:hypothetical protein
MSNKESVFLPSNGGSNQFQDLLSATSAPNWSKVETETGSANNSKNLMNEINGLLSEVRRNNIVATPVDGLVEQFDQSGGAKKKGKKSKTKSKSKSSGKKQSRPKKVEKSKTKTKSKSASKKKRMSGGNDETKPKKQMNDKLKQMRKLAEFVKSEMPDLKDGPPMIKTVSDIIKAHGMDEAHDWIKNNNSKVKKMYDEILKVQKENREKKKAEKAKSKSISSSE